jgi:hypothetical protein
MEATTKTKKRMAIKMEVAQRKSRMVMGRMMTRE